MKQCDTCLKETDDLYDLLTSHQTKEIKQVCSSCRKVLDDHKDKLHAVTTNILLGWFKQFIEEKRTKAKDVP